MFPEKGARKIHSKAQNTGTYLIGSHDSTVLINTEKFNRLFLNIKEIRTRKLPQNKKFF